MEKPREYQRITGRDGNDIIEKRVDPGNDPPDLDSGWAYRAIR